MLDGLGILFGSFPRDVGNPKRHVVYRRKELDQFIAMNDGVNSCFIAAYAHDYMIDKLFFDFDEPFAFEQASKFAEWLYNNSVPYVPIITGNKGFHIHVILFPEKLEGSEAEQKSRLRNTQLSLMEQSGCYFPVEIRKYDVPQSLLPFYIEAKESNYRKKIPYYHFSQISNESIYQAKYNSEGVVAYTRVSEPTKTSIMVPACDMQVMGDLNRLCRIPNTKRKLPAGFNFCTYLPLDFFTMDQATVYEHQKSHNDFTSPRGNYQTISELEKPVTINFRQIILEASNNSEAETYFMPDAPIVQLVKEIMTPVIFRGLTSPEPPQVIRFAAVAEMKAAGLSQHEIFEVLTQFKWSDRDDDIIKYQIDNIFKNDYKPMSKKALVESGVTTWHELYRR